MGVRWVNGWNTSVPRIHMNITPERTVRSRPRTSRISKSMHSPWRWLMGQSRRNELKPGVCGLSNHAEMPRIYRDFGRGAGPALMRGGVTPFPDNPDHDSLRLSSAGDG